MNFGNIKLGITGDKLIESINEEKSVRQPIAEGLLYEKTCLMISADPGVGKSTVSAQVAVELAAGLPLFGNFNVPKPMKILYAQNERHIYETLDRLKTISKVLPITKNNIVVTDEYQKLNMLNVGHADLLLQCVMRDCPGVEVIFLDPIYPMVSGGLSRDEPASAFTKAMSILEKETGAAVWWNHHTVKDTFDQKTGRKIDKDDPFYGSQWIKAHVTGAYHMKKTKEGVSLTCKKDNYSLLTKEIYLDYDSETDICSVMGDKLPAIDRLRRYLRAQKANDNEFTFEEMRVGIQVSTAMLRKLLLDTRNENAFKVRKGNKNKNFYMVKGV